VFVGELVLCSSVDKNNTLHSFMLVRHGRVVADGWWKPEAPHKPHVLHSLSKSFNSTAGGLERFSSKLWLWPVASY